MRTPEQAEFTPGTPGAEVFRQLCGRIARLMGRCQPQHFLYLIADEPWLLTELFDFTLRHMQVLIPFRTGIKPYLLTIGLIQLNTHMLNIHITLIASRAAAPAKRERSASSSRLLPVPRPPMMATISWLRGMDSFLKLISWPSKIVPSTSI
jgi:hypothetical protein